MTSYTLRVNFDYPLKEWRTETQKIEHLDNKKNRLDEIKRFFIVFEGVSFGAKKKM